MALDNYTAIDILDDTYRVIKSDKYAKAYKVMPMVGEVKIEEVEATHKFEEISKIFNAVFET